MFTAHPALEVSFTVVAANHHGGTVAATIVDMMAVSVHFVAAAVAPPAAAAVAVAAVLATVDAAVDAAVVALLVDVVFDMRFVLVFMTHSTPEVSFESAWALFFKMREGIEGGGLCAMIEYV